MFKNLIAFFVALTIMLTGVVSPAYAESNIAPESTIIAESNVVEDLGQKIVEVTEGIAATVIVCYAIDGIAATFFPPAAALSAFCPTAGLGSTGVASIIK